ncbi:serine hydrolase [Frigidibacter sp. RF13]|uniref:serine hydrolase domain-containing protein n=1 Tax=Frigidibacter sp. RF13 TaxID=2997340 RepID=UPI00226E0EEE|nr:serine hydrolase [Frigidibacter sp. RF13]MCY1128251.1 serine hydrolase [Frigidibacter sp. RF13]
MVTTVPNPDLTVAAGGYTSWNSAPRRRSGFHGLHRIARYAQSARAGRVMELRLSADLSIAAREDVRRLTASPWFSAMAVIEGGRILHEAYAADFGPDRPHSIMSISKMAMNLVIGRLWEDGRIKLEEQMGKIVPGVGPGYAGASVADILNMNVENDYDEDYAQPGCAAFRQEAATGLRLPDGPEETNAAFLATVGLTPGRSDTVNRTGACLYKSANTDLLARAAELRSGRPMSAFITDLADAAGMEGAMHVVTDRAGFPLMSGGICLTARDLCRYGALFARRGAGVDGRPFGSAAFIEETLTGGVPMPPPRAHLRYSNQTNTDGIWLGHGGYGGQYLVANPSTGRVACYLSVMQNDSGYDSAYYPPVIAMLAEICAAA